MRRYEISLVVTIRWLAESCYKSWVTIFSILIYIMYTSLKTKTRKSLVFASEYPRAAVGPIFNLHTDSMFDIIVIIVLFKSLPSVGRIGSQS